MSSATELMSKMKALLNVAVEHNKTIKCSACKTNDVCEISLYPFSCVSKYLACVATGRIYKTGRLRKVKNYSMDSCNRLFDKAAAFNRTYKIDCDTCPISKECHQLGFSCSSSFLLCVIFGIIDVNGELKH